MIDRQDRPDNRKTGSATGPACRRKISSEALMQGDRRLVIVHNGTEYILQVTRADRLILTK